MFALGMNPETLFDSTTVYIFHVGAATAAGLIGAVDDDEKAASQVRSKVTIHLP